jgi:hypothetical protein
MDSDPNAVYRLAPERFLTQWITAIYLTRKLSKQPRYIKIVIFRKKVHHLFGI